MTGHSFSDEAKNDRYIYHLQRLLSIDKMASMGWLLNRKPVKEVRFQGIKTSEIACRAPVSGVYSGLLTDVGPCVHLFPMRRSLTAVKRVPGRFRGSCVKNERFIISQQPKIWPIFSPFSSCRNDRIPLWLRLSEAGWVLWIPTGRARPPAPASSRHATYSWKPVCLIRETIMPLKYSGQTLSWNLN
jgi:hypothetical protein